ncbi:hypothetical protein ACHWQZ_G002446 [Mnemiopsis leidyi]
MVIVLPAGAQIPAISCSRSSQNSQNVKRTSYSQEFLRDSVSSFVSELDASSACSTYLYTLNIESVLPFHLKQRPTPREIGVVMFSLDLGVSDQKYHAFIDPGSLPRGFMHEAQYHSETHQIPVLDFKEKTTDCTTVYEEIVTFLDASDVVFTPSSLVAYTQEALDWIAGAKGKFARSRILVLPLEMLVGELILLATGETRHTIRLTDELRPQILQHVTHFGCEYHASQDIPVCALSSSHRQAVATHGLLQKFFWDQLTKLDFNSSPECLHSAETTALRSYMSNCTISTQDPRHGEPATNSSGKQNSSEKVSDPIIKTDMARSNQLSCKERRSSDESVDSSVFSLPDIFRNNKDNSTVTPSLKDDKDRVNVQSTGPLAHNIVHNVHKPGLSMSSPHEQSTDRSVRRIGLGRGFLKTTLIPPRRPNS